MKNTLLYMNLTHPRSKSHNLIQLTRSKNGQTSHPQGTERVLTSTSYTTWFNSHISKNGQTNHPLSTERVQAYSSPSTQIFSVNEKHLVIHEPSHPLSHSHIHTQPTQPKNGQTKSKTLNHCHSNHSTTHPLSVPRGSPISTPFRTKSEIWLD